MSKFRILEPSESTVNLVQDGDDVQLIVDGVSIGFFDGSDRTLYLYRDDIEEADLSLEVVPAPSLEEEL